MLAALRAVIETQGLFCALLSAPPTNQSPCVPKSWVPSPNMRPKPRTRKATEETANTMKFLASTVTVFLARQNPDSTIANPRPVKKTRNAVTSVQIVSRRPWRRWFSR